MRRRLLAGLLVLAAVSPLGCSSVKTNAPAPASVSATPTVTPSAAGSYPSGTRLVLSNGASLTVPDRWRAQLYTTGALVSAPPVDSGVIGGMMDVPAVPHWGSVGFCVYGPSAGFATDVAQYELRYQRSRGSNPATARFTVTRSNLSLNGGSVTATAYVTTRSGKPRRHDIAAFVEGRDAAPMVVSSSFSTLPAGFGSAIESEMPRLLLDYLGLRWQ